MAIKNEFSEDYTLVNSERQTIMLFPQLQLQQQKVHRPQTLVIQ